MLTCTLRQIADMESAQSAIYSTIIKYTGAPAVYGLDTPIDVLDIIDNVSLGAGLACMEYVDGNIDLGKTLSIELTSLILPIWAKLFPGDTRVVDFLALCQRYMESDDTVVEPKVDYCGDPIPGFYGVIPEGQITDALASIVASIDALSTDPVIYTHYFYITNGFDSSKSVDEQSSAFASEYNDIGAGRWEVSMTPTVDDISNLPPVITHEMLGDEDYAYLTLGKSLENPYFMCQFYATTLQTSFLYYVQFLVERPILDSSVDEGINYYTQAALDIKIVLQDLWSILKSSIFLLPALAVSVLHCRTNYATQRYLETQPMYNRVKQLAHDGKWGSYVYNVYTAEGDNTFVLAERDIIGAGDTAKAEYLKDYQEILLQSQLGNYFEGEGKTREEAFAEITAANASIVFYESDLDDIARGAREAARAARMYKASIYLSDLDGERLSLLTLRSESPLIDIIKPYLL